MNSGKRLWILEDEEGCRFVYEQILELRYRTRYFENVASLAEALRDPGEPKPALIIADLMLPDGCFLDLLSLPQTESLCGIPFLVISSIDDLDALRFCFEEGALDYLVKPFKKNELIVKIERALELQASSPPRPAFEDLEQGLTLKERQILRLFFESPDRTVTRNAILESIWKGIRVHPKTVDVHLYNLRKKLKVHGYEISCSGHQQWLLSGDRVNHPVLLEISGHEITPPTESQRKPR